MKLIYELHLISEFVFNPASTRGATEDTFEELFFCNSSVYKPEDSIYIYCSYFLKAISTSLSKYGTLNTPL